MDAQVIPYPAYQRFAAVAYRSVRDKSMIHGLLEVDVSWAREQLRRHHAATGEALSFTAFLAACVAKAVDEHKAVQAFRLGRRRLVVFDDVDVAVRVEHDVAGQKYVVPCILRAAHRKTVRALHDEIRGAQAADVRRVLARAGSLPAVLYRPLVWAFVTIAGRRPRLWKQTMGTVGLTSVGMFGQGGGWGIPAPSPTALMVTVGGIGTREAMVDGRVAVREYLSLTVSVDHDVVDGAPAARFAQRLKELIEMAHGLGDVTDPAMPSAPGTTPAPRERCPDECPS
jgi:hypothetical protein